MLGVGFEVAVIGVLLTCTGRLSIIDEVAPFPQDFPALQVILAQLEERVPLGSRAMRDPKAKQVQRESLDLKVGGW